MSSIISARDIIRLGYAVRELHPGKETEGIDGRPTFEGYFVWFTDGSTTTITFDQLDKHGTR